MKRGLTLIEVLIVTGLLAILIGVSVYVFIAVLRTWPGQETRTGIEISLDASVKGMARELRTAQDLYAKNDGEIRFSQDKSAYYIYYLYNSDDPYPPAFSNPDYSYELRKAPLSGGKDGTFTYGLGDLMASGIRSPSAFSPARPAMSVSGDTAVVDITISRGDETIRSRTQVKARNYTP